MKKPFFYFMALAMTISVFACKKDKGEAAGTTEAQEVKKKDNEAVTYRVNTAASTINWEGYKPTGTHNGTVNIKKGTVDVKGDQMTGGSFVIDMNSITNLDQEGDMKAGLEAHLKGSDEEKANDFFNTSEYPTAKFEITKAVDYESKDEDETANAMVYGNLTLKGKTNNVGFKANIKTSDNKVVVSTPKFNIDRTKWDVHYGSKSIFDNLGDEYINDEIGLTINLVASK